MEGWNEARMDIGFYDDQQAVIGAQCAVRSVGDSLTFTCRFPAEEVTLHGLRNGQGHYHLVAPDGSMQATLHRFKDSRIMEGFWTRRGRRGFWRVQLPEAALAAEPVKRIVRKKTKAASRPAAKKRKRSPAVAA